MNSFRGWDIEPQTAEEITECATVEGMRRRIQKYRYNDAFTRAVLDSAYVRGLSGEDTMTVLAFEALRRLERLTDVQIDHVMRSPMPPLIVRSV